MNSARLVKALLASTALVGAAQAQQLPTAPKVQSGDVRFDNSTANTLKIQQTTPNAVVNWQSFNIGQNNKVDIQQLNQNSVLLNRVTGDTPSTIAGQLKATGQVFLVNPNGVIITKTGEVIAAGFTASSLNISDKDFLEGRFKFFGLGASASVENEGRITTSPQGYVALIGGKVSNSGSIIVPTGKVALGSGEQATLDPSGDGFLQVALPSKVGGDDALVKNSGKISAGVVKLTAAAARDAARQAINMSGVIEAKSVTGGDGEIILGGGEGTVDISGKLDASSATAKGGKVTVTGRNIQLKAAQIDASGATGGGKLRIGGDYQGKGTLQRAETLKVDSKSVIKADATKKGDGGNIVLWSDDLTSYSGFISARGGIDGGNGGDAEVSGMRQLAFNGMADLSASNGFSGTLLLDPADLTISTGPSAQVQADQATSTYQAGGINSFLSLETIRTLLNAGTNVTVKTTNDAHAGNGNITLATALSWNSTAQLKLDAFGSVIFNKGVTTQGGGLLDVKALGSIIVNESLSIGDNGGLKFDAGSKIEINKTINIGANVAVSLILPDTRNLLFKPGASFEFGATDQQSRLDINGDSYKLVYSESDLEAINTDLTSRFALATNLTLSRTYQNAMIARGDTSSNVAFSGVLDGLGHQIRNLTIKSNTLNDRIGLFGNLTGDVRNLHLLDAYVRGSQTVMGGLIAGRSSGSIRNVSVSGEVTAQTSSGTLGGLVGLLDTATGIIERVSTNVFVGGGGAGAYGGIAGRVAGGRISIARADGEVWSDAAGSRLGGIAGEADRATINQVLSDIRIELTAAAGGLVGNAINSAVTNSYWNSAISGPNAFNVDGGGNTLTGTASWNGLQVPAPTLLAMTGLNAGDWSNSATEAPILQLLGPTVAPKQTVEMSGVVFTDAGFTRHSGGVVSIYDNGTVFNNIRVLGDGSWSYDLKRNTRSQNGFVTVYQPVGSQTITSLRFDPTITKGINQRDLWVNYVTFTTSNAQLGNVRTGAQIIADGGALYTRALGAALNTVTTAVDALQGRVITATGAFNLNVDVGEQAGGNLIIKNLFVTADRAINVKAVQNVTSGATLSLTGNNINISSNVNVNGGQLTLNALSGRLPTLDRNVVINFTNVAGTGLTINGNNYRILYTMADIDMLDGDDGTGAPGTPVEVNGFFALGTDITSTAIYGRSLVSRLGANAVFEGFGHKITGLRIANANANNNIGLFGEVRGSVRNLILFDATVSAGASSKAGILAGFLNAQNTDATIENVVTRGTVNAGADSFVGGLVGDISVAGGRRTATVSSSNSWASVSVGANGEAGGLIGRANIPALGSIKIERSFAQGDVTGGDNSKLGGFIGENIKGQISDSFALGAVRGGAGSFVASFAGYDNGGTISTSFGAGFLDGTNEAGFANRADASTSIFTNVYYNREATGAATDFGTGSNQSAIGMTTDEMMNRLLPGFDATIWSRNAVGYNYQTSLMPGGIVVLSGRAFETWQDQAAVGRDIHLSRLREYLGRVTSGADGLYYFMLEQGPSTGNNYIAAMTRTDTKLGASLSARSGKRMQVSKVSISERLRRLGIQRNMKVLRCFARGLAFNPIMPTSLRRLASRILSQTTLCQSSMACR